MLCIYFTVRYMISYTLITLGLFVLMLKLNKSIMLLDLQPILPFGMNSWIADVKNTAYCLDTAGVMIIDEDIILALTAGLLELYATLIVTFDNLPLIELMLSNLITRLLNEEMQQNAHEDIMELSGPIYSVQDAKNTKIKTQLSEITCYNCGKKSHYKSNCPVPKKENEMGEKHVASLF